MVKSNQNQRRSPSRRTRILAVLTALLAVASLAMSLWIPQETVKNNHGVQILMALIATLVAVAAVMSAVDAAKASRDKKRAKKENTTSS